jgi:L-aspartate oxidase
VGEVARTGVHGANRLASNSLLEGAVFGARAAAALSMPAPAHAPAPAWRADTVSPDSPAAHAFSRPALQQLMWDHVGLLRTDDGLAHALDVIRSWRASVPAPRDATDHEDANLLLLAEETVSAARRRTASVGAHFREPALIGV